MSFFSDQPSRTRSPRTSSESATFIWQPSVQMWNAGMSGTPANSGTMRHEAPCEAVTLAEGVGFEPTIEETLDKRLAGARTRPLCDPSGGRRS